MMNSMNRIYHIRFDKYRNSKQPSQFYKPALVESVFRYAVPFSYLMSAEQFKKSLKQKQKRGKKRRSGFLRSLKDLKNRNPFANGFIQ